MEPSDRRRLWAVLTRQMENAAEPVITSEQHRQWVRLIAHLERALLLLDELEEGDSQTAALAQRAVDEAKKELRLRLRARCPVRDALMAGGRRWPLYPVQG